MYLKLAKRISSIFQFPVLLLLLVAMTFSSPTSAQKSSLSYLALGDSYTIGEGVDLGDRYPMQLVREWNKKEKTPFTAPLIIAKTGWTVDELEVGIQTTATAAEGYDLVTLLIGVNNQYRGRSVETFATDFERILEKAIRFARGNKSRVIVLSIPDWGVTPFALQKGVDPVVVAREISSYNQLKKKICEKHEIKFIDITSEYRMEGGLPESVVADGLHPSKQIYGDWMQKILTELKQINFD